MNHQNLRGADLHSPSTELVENNSGSTLTKLKCVQFNGQGTNYPNIIVVSGSNSTLFKGIVQADILTGTSGHITSLGFMNAVDTSAWASGTLLYIDGSGNLSTIVLGSSVAYVLKQDATQGILYVNRLGLTGPTGVIAATPPLNYDSGTQTVSITLADATHSGYLSLTDWNTFNNKQASGNYITALTGDVTATGPGSVAATIASNAVTNAKLAQMAANTLKGNNTGITANALDLTVSQVKTLLGVGAANGIAPLDGGAKVPAANLPSTLMNYRGAWNASTNSPTLADGTGANGDVYRASVAGSQDLGSGTQTWGVGDFAIYNGSIWQHSPAADGVTSVNGMTGAVVVNAINQLTGDVTTSAASGSQSEAATVAKIQGTTVSGTTGSGNVVFSASPTLTGTITAAAANFSGAITASNLSGTNTGDLTLTAVGSSPSANAASLSGQALTLQPADGTHPGVITSGTQTIGGNKTFTGTISASNLSGTNTGDQTITLTGDVTGSGTGSFATTYNGVVPINKGGTGQTTANAGFNALSPMTTGGDLIYGGASGVGTRLANGTAGQVLTSAGTTLAPIWATPTTGTVTSVSVVSANGLAGTVATATTTPAITLSTTVTGVLKGNGTAISAATSGTDYSAGTSALATGILKSTTGTGALTIAVAGDFPTLNQNTTGTASNVTGVVAIANGGTGQTTANAAFNALSPMTTGGDIIYGGASGVATRLANGSNGQVLTSSGGTSAPTWTTVSSGGGITSINADTTAAQLIVAASTGTDFTIGTSGGTTTVAIPSASATARGLVTTGTQTLAGAKTFTSLATFTGVPSGTGIGQGSIYVNPASATADYTLVGVAIAGVQSFKIDSSNNISGGGTSAASGGGSTAFGNAATASGLASFAIGDGSSATGVRSTAMGYSTLASGNYSIALGEACHSTQEACFSSGQGSYATSSYATAMGNGTTASGAASMSTGQVTTASGAYSFAGGQNSTATADYAFSFGSSNAVTSAFSVGFGQRATIGGEWAFGFGQDATANGEGSFAGGLQVNALSQSSFTFGDTNESSGIGAVTVGKWLYSHKSYGLVFGRGVSSGTRLVAPSDDSFSVGFNTDQPSLYVGVASGAGTNGNVGIGTSTPGKLLDINGTANVVDAITMNAAVATPSYQTSSPATGGTVTCSANKPGILITPAGTLATLTIKLPSSPIDGQQFWVACSQVITATTWQDSGGTAGNVNGGKTTFGAANQGQTFVYSSGTTTWYAI